MNFVHPKDVYIEFVDTSDGSSVIISMEQFLQTIQLCWFLIYDRILAEDPNSN